MIGLPAIARLQRFGLGLSGVAALALVVVAAVPNALRVHAEEPTTQMAAVIDASDAPIDRFSKSGAAVWLRTAEAAAPQPGGPVMIPPAAKPDAQDGHEEQVKPSEGAPAKGTGPKAASQKHGKSEASAKDGEPKPKFIKPVKSGGLAQQYCVNISDAAADARFAWQAKTIADFEKELDARIKVLEAKTEEYKKWLDRRNDFINRAHQKLVDIYTKMKPDAVALQMAALEEETAAAVVFRLEPRVASSILNEMEPEKAARISALIARSAVTSAAAKPAAPGAPAPDGRS